MHSVIVINALIGLIALPSHNSPPPAEDLWILIALPLSSFSWIILARMNGAWILDRPIHWLWPVTGTLLALGWLAPIPNGWIFAAIVAPGVALAIYLVIWNIWRWRQVNNTF